MVLYSEKCDIRLDGKTAIVTGSNTGIGKETVKDLYKRGAYVIMACRNTEKAEEAAADIVASCKPYLDVGKLVVVVLDVSSLKSVREFSEKVLAEQDRIDILVNNAGIFCTPYGKTEDGYEQQFATNHLGHFLLTLLLLPKIIQSAPSRIVNVSSSLHESGKIDFNDINWERRNYSPLAAYSQSKLCNVLFSSELANRLTDANIEDVNVYCLHPGVVATDAKKYLDKAYFKGMTYIMNKIMNSFIKTPVEGAQTTIYCAIDEQAGTQTGLYYSSCKPKRPSRDGQNMDYAKKLWDMSLDMVNLGDYKIVKS